MLMVLRGFHEDTGIFGPKAENHIYKIGLRDGREIRYRTAYELGYLVGYGKLPLENPLDPATTEFDKFYDGVHDGREKRKKDKGSYSA